jgi:hypothetical protein
MPAPNAILAMLDAASIPWTISRVEVVKQYGIRTDPWFEREIVLLDTPRPLLSGLLRPIEIAVSRRYAPGLPPNELRGFVHHSDDALHNLGTIAADLSARLGTGRSFDSANTRGWRWRHGGSTVKLMCWPPELQQLGLRNTAHEREPRLAAASHLYIWTGYGPPTTIEEQAALDEFEEIGRLGEAREGAIGRRPSEYELEFVRAPGADSGRFAGRVGLSRGHLIFGWDQLYVVAVERILRFELLHLTPARGSGGAYLYAHCATAIPAWPEKRLGITAALGIDRAEALASRLARATGKPLERRTVPDE